MEALRPKGWCLAQGTREITIATLRRDQSVYTIALVVSHDVNVRFTQIRLKIDPAGATESFPVRLPENGILIDSGFNIPTNLKLDLGFFEDVLEMNIGTEAIEVFKAYLYQVVAALFQIPGPQPQHLPQKRQNPSLAGFPNCIPLLIASLLMFLGQDRSSK